jgi:hypothetical protein
MSAGTKNARDYPTLTARGAIAVDHVRVVQDLDPTQAGDDFLRVSCQGEEAEGTGVFTVIERVVASEPRDGLPWRFRKLFAGLFTSAESALAVATAYARHKGIPVVYAEVDRRPR